MKRFLIPGLCVFLLALFSVPAMAGSPGQGNGGGGGSGGGGGGGNGPTLAAYCSNPSANQPEPAGTVRPGDPDSCVISVRSGQLASGSLVGLFFAQPPLSALSCSSASVGRPTGGPSCTLAIGPTAPGGTQIGRADFTVSSNASPGTAVQISANVCNPSCQNAQVSVTGPGSSVHARPSPPPPPSFPFAVSICQGENTGGSASAGQLDSCTITASVGNTYTTGESIKMTPNSPPGTTVANCQGFTAGSYQTAGMIDSSGYCFLTVVSGTVPQFETLGTLTVRIAGDAMAGLPVDQFIDFCNPPDASGTRTCAGVIGIMPAFGPGASVSPDPLISANGVAISGTEGQAVSGTVATFSDGDPNGTSAMYSATINWGDGTESTDGVTGANAAAGAFDVTGSHLYAEEGTYTITVSISDIDTAYFNSTTATSTATIVDAPLNASGHDANTTNPFNGTLATFTDGNPSPTLGDFGATIDWGDNTSSSGTIAQNGTAFDVSGSHTYANLGPYTVSIQICDVGGSCASATANHLVYGLSDAGNFVIGDGSAAPATAVTFWGAQWASANTLSGGPAPSAFKGFSDTPAAAPTCGTAWSSGPGNSAQPPASIPTYMAVIVASTVSKSGPQVSGDSVHVVVVKTDAAYAGNPGHAGTGSVVAQLC